MPSLESGADHGKAMWYSFNLGPVHFVVVDTETDFPGADGDHHTWYGGDNGGFGDQLAWLEEVCRKCHADTLFCHCCFSAAVVVVAVVVAMFVVLFFFGDRMCIFREKS